jgi:flavin-dependent dehydrogenase
MKKIFADVLVVGAGVAGTVAALKLAKEGKSVVIIEKLKKVGSHNHEKIDITESSDLDSIFSELELPHIGRFNRSIWHSPSHSFVLHSKVHDYYIMRGSGNNSFESIVSKRAKKHGALFWTNSYIETVNSRNGCFSEVMIRKGANLVAVIPKFIIGADGLNSDTLVKFGFANLETKGIELAGYGGVCSNLNIQPGETHVFFNSEFAPGGYFYLGMTKNKIGVASVVIDKAKQSGKPLGHFFRNFINNSEKLGNAMKGVKMHNIFVGSGKANILKKRVNGNFALIGDAGRVMDPIFGYGVRQAIISGYLSAECIVNNFSNQQCLQIYERKLREGVLRNEFESHYLRSILNKIDNPSLDSLIQILIEIDKKQDLDSVFSDGKKFTLSLLAVFIKKPREVISLLVKVIF